MPKEKTRRVQLSRKARALTPYYKSRQKQLGSPKTDISAVKEDWRDAVCPICMNPPHNSVLLLCSSYEKGCRPYICDTSPRHSHCLSQFMKHAVSDEPSHIREGLDGILEFENMDNTAVHSERSGEEHNQNFASRDGLDKVDALKLSCPLCRGQVKGLVTVKAAREYLNSKTRSCTAESCSFVGDYQQLRRHARKDHPHARPRKVDPNRLKEWQRLEQESNIGDVFSTIRSTLPGALVFGDYVIEDGQTGISSDEGNWWSFLLLVQYLDPHAQITIRRTIPSQDRDQRRNSLATITFVGDNSSDSNNSRAYGNASLSHARSGAARSARDRLERLVHRRRREQPHSQ